MVSDLISTWGPRIKFVDDLTALEIVPRNSPSYMNHIVSDIQTFACHNNMKLNPEKCKEMIVDFLQYNATKWQPICINGKQVVVVTVFKLLEVYLSSDLTWTVIRVQYCRIYSIRTNGVDS